MKFTIIFGLIMVMVVAAWSQPIDFENFQFSEQDNTGRQNITYLSIS